MPALHDIIREGRLIAGHRPWPRAMVSARQWQLAAAEAADGRLTLSGLWGDAGVVHMALLDEESGAAAVLSLECPEGRFPSVGRLHPPAIRLERALRDIHGLEPVDCPDPRPWIDHAGGAPYPFLTAEGDSLHQIAVGPVHAGIIEPGHFRFTANGETVVRLEERLGYVHRGIEKLMRGAMLEQGAKLAERVSGDSTVAYALAFARAVEAALELEPPPRAPYIRGLMTELERLANHLGDIGAICNDASFAMMHAHCGILRERVLRAAHGCFGHRLMRDCIRPGGVARDIDAAGLAVLEALIADIRRHFPALVKLYDNTASLQDRTVTTGILKPALARQFGAGGYVGRASGRAFDVRRNIAYPPYDELEFNVPSLTEGDVNARVWIRIREVEQSLSLIEQMMARLPAGPVMTAVTPSAGEGMSLVEGFRGDVLVWLRLDDDGRIARCHLRDPSWFQWPLLEAVIEGNIVADFPLCNKSFNCSYAGHDL